MVMWVFGYGSLIWKAGFPYDDRLVGFIKDHRRVFDQGSTDHRGTPEFPGRTVTLESAAGEVCWGAAYRISDEKDKRTAITDPAAITPAVSGVMVYIGSPDKKINPNYLGPAPLEDIARQIVLAEGPSGPNRDYLFQLEKALLQIGCEDKHVKDLADEVRRLLSERKLKGEEV
ncbi:gamma-glutamylcyclotransferase 2-3 isoform X3 [Syzygium oleosum]|uniref:gamma-glutamylcyclotransferase 2-3 isoform X3 n=1 Tax=Syzygium oleosum TaxID=219896 RepID=UPI0024BA5632|nr:gamma-glutamylcyclotransferase 2-3 isoform X3 [Syzygium oleosum]